MENGAVIKPAVDELQEMADSNRRAPAIEFEPNDPRAYGALALVYKQKGMYEDVVRAEQKAMNLSGASPEDLAALDRAYRESGPKGYLGLLAVSLQGCLGHRLTTAADARRRARKCPYPPG